MTLFIPRLPAEARPPVGFPPLHKGSADLLCAAGFTTVALLGCNCLSSVGQGLFLAVCSVLAFCYVSKLAIGRSHWWQSRYCSAGELGKVVVFAVASHALLGTGAGAAGLLASSAGFQTGLFVALHLVYADGSAFLQAFGLRWSDTSRWASCSGPEVVLASLILLGAATLIGASLAALLLLASKEALYVAAGKTVAMIAVIAAAAFLYRGSHDLHPHHYLGGMLLLPLASAASAAAAGASSSSSSLSLLLPPLALSALRALSSFGAGLSFGLVVEGAATWGMDPILVRRRRGRQQGSQAAAEVEPVDHPTIVWVSAVASFASHRTSAAVARTLTRILRAARPAILDDTSVVVRRMLEPWLPSSSSKSSTADDTVAPVMALRRLLDELAGAASNDVPGKGKAPHQRSNKRAASPSKLKRTSQAHKQAAAATNSDSESPAVPMAPSNGPRREEDFKQRLEALARRIEQSPQKAAPSSSAEVVAFAVLNSTLCACNAGSFELAQTIALKSKLRAESNVDATDESQAATATEEFFLSLIACCGGYVEPTQPQQSSGSDTTLRSRRRAKEAFDERHERWRAARDAFYSRVLSPEQRMEADALQDDIAALVDEASSMTV